MPRPRLWHVVLLLAVPIPATAAPLDLVPKDTSLILAVEQPRALAEATRDLPAYRSSAKAIPAVRELLDSTPARRLFQFVAFAEKELGSAWPDLIDRVAGGGMALGVKPGTDPPPILLVVRGTDESAVAEAFKLFIRVVEEETARQLGPKARDGLRKADYRGTPTVHGGDDFHAARIGNAILVSNREAELHASLDLALGRTAGASAADIPGPRAALKLLDRDPLAWLWYDLAAGKKTKAAEDFFANTRKDLFQTLTVGGTIDAVRRADLVAAGLHRSPDGFALTVRLPAKRADLPPEFALHVPSDGRPGSLPLLEPPGVLYSQSFHLDLGSFWAERKKIINEKQLKDVEKGVKEVSRVMLGTSLDQLFEQSGPYHRVVVVSRDDKPYSVESNQPIPPFALVSSMRDPAFGKSATSALRAAALLASFEAKLKMTEETHDGVTVVSYRFPEDGEYKPAGGDPEKLRFNFVPSFAVVGDSFVVASRPELIRDLIPELKRPADPAAGSPAVWRAKGYANGVADLIRANPEPVVTNTILSDGVGLDAARKQVADFVTWARTLGTVEMAIDHRAEAFQVRLEWKTK